MTSCKNCNTQFEGNFCNQCGQSAKTHPMNFHFVLHDIQHGLLHFDKGVPYTLKALATRPGHAIRNYIEGKRVNFFKPISLVILLASFYAVLSLYFDVRFKGLELSTDPKQIAYQAQISNWINAHYVSFMLLTLPLWTIGSYISFLKQKYNYVEHFILNAYVLCQSLVIQLLLFPISFYYKDTPHQSLVVSLSSLLHILVAIWTYSQFFNKLPKIKSILYSILAYVIMISIVTIVSMVVGIALVLLNKV